MSEASADRLYAEMQTLQLDLLKPVRFSALQAAAIEQNGFAPKVPAFNQACRGMSIAEFQTAADEKVMAYVRSQTTLQKNTEEEFGNDDALIAYDVPQEVRDFARQYRQDVDKLVARAFGNAGAAKAICELGPTQNTRAPRLHVDSHIACTSRLGALPTLVLNPDNFQAANERARALYDQLPESAKQSIAEGVWVLPEQETYQLQHEGHLVPSRLGVVTLNLTGTKQTVKDRFENGFLHASSKADTDQPVHSGFFLATLRSAGHPRI